MLGNCSGLLEEVAFGWLLIGRDKCTQGKDQTEPAV